MERYGSENKTSNDRKNTAFVVICLAFFGDFGDIALWRDYLFGSSLSLNGGSLDFHYSAIVNPSDVLGVLLMYLENC
jgi:hypothetical protein